MLKTPDVILVVDDDAAVRNALKFALEVEGFSVRLYATPEALLAEKDLPAAGCLVIDYRMPEIDGLELVERLQSLGVTLPVFLISGRVTRSLRDRAPGRCFGALLRGMAGPPGQDRGRNRRCGGGRPRQTQRPLGRSRQLGP